MCYSASASFAAAGILTGIGVVGLLAAKNKRLWMYAGTPLLFAIQQASEGVVWLSFTNQVFQPLRATATYVFLLFAWVFWPLWVPLGLYVFEPIHLRRRILGGFVFLSSLWSAYVLYILATHPAYSQTVSCHIAYDVSGVFYHTFYQRLFGYVLCTVVPLFISSAPYATLLGCTFMIALLVTHYIALIALTSVWCFWAAILSIIILLGVLRKERSSVTK